MSNFFRTSNSHIPLAKLCFGAKTNSSGLINEPIIFGVGSSTTLCEIDFEGQLNHHMMSTPKKVESDTALKHCGKLVLAAPIEKVIETQFKTKIDGLVEKEENVLEVTEGREVDITTSFENEEDVMSQLVSEHNSTRTSDGKWEGDTLSLDYLLNALKSLRQAKELLEFKLKKVKGENGDIKSLLKTQTETLNRIKNKSLKLVKQMKGSEEEVFLFKSKLNEISTIAKKSRAELNNLKEENAKSSELVNVLQGTITGFKDQMAINQSTSIRISQKINRLRAKIDGLSGSLSEEKIKNSELTKNLQEARGSFDTQLFQKSFENADKLQLLLDGNCKIIGTLSNVQAMMIDTISIINEDHGKSCVNLKNDLSKKVDQLASQIKESKQEQAAFVNSSISNIMECNKDSAQNIIYAISSEDRNILNCFHEKSKELLHQVIPSTSNETVKEIKTILEATQSSLAKNAQLTESFAEERKVFGAEQTKLRNVIDSLRSLLEQKSASVSQLKNDLHTLTGNFNRRGKNLSEYKQEIDKLEKKIDDLVLEFAKEKKSIISNFQHKLELKEAEIAQNQFDRQPECIAITEENGRLKMNLDELTEKVGQLVKSVNELEQKLVKSHELAQSKITEMNALKKCISRQENEQKKQAQELISKEKYVHFVSLENQKLSTEIEKLSTEHEQAQKLAEEKQLKIDAVSTKLKELEQINTILENSLDESNENLNSTLDKVVELEKRISSNNVDTREANNKLLFGMIKSNISDIGKIKNDSLNAVSIDIIPPGTNRPKRQVADDTENILLDTDSQAKEKSLKSQCISNKKFKGKKQSRLKAVNFKKRKLIESSSQISNSENSKKTVKPPEKKSRNDSEALSEIPDFFSDMKSLNSKKGKEASYFKHK